VIYAWLSKVHPDPDSFHLECLVEELDKVEAVYEDMILMDWMARWQRHGENKKTNRGTV